eukprot:356681-Chlamydomonas_euryale.AAC.1
MPLACTCTAAKTLFRKRQWLTMELISFSSGSADSGATPGRGGSLMCWLGSLRDVGALMCGMCGLVASCTMPGEWCSKQRLPGEGGVPCQGKK